MIFTSYFANIKNLSKRQNRSLVSISRYTPKWAEEAYPSLSYAEELAPSKTLLEEYKRGEMSEEEYERIYREETLSRLDPSSVYKDLNHSTLLCYEKTGDFCHRHIVEKWLWENGFGSEEAKQEPVSIAVIGSRGYSDRKTFNLIMDRLILDFENVRFVSGGAKTGADHLIVKYAKDRNIPLKEILPDWDGLGKSAGFARNVNIWEESDFGIAFWDGESKGTEHSLDISKKQNKKLYIYNFTKKDLYLQKVQYGNKNKKTNQVIKGEGLFA